MNHATRNNVYDDALNAFWEAVLQHYPQAETGDLSPWATVQLTLAAEIAIEEWVFNNVPTSETDTDNNQTKGD